MSLFNQTIRERKPKKTRFNLSHSKLLTSDFYKLTPILCQEVLPGDSFNLRTAMQVKMAPLVMPTMHEMSAYIHYYFVPNRILWKRWPDYIQGNDSTKAATTGGSNNYNHFPRIKLNSVNNVTSGNQFDLNMKYFIGNGSLMDYLGIDPETIYAKPLASNMSAPGVLPMINPFAMAAYQKIYDEYYRDTDLDDVNPVLDWLYNWDDNVVYPIQSPQGVEDFNPATPPSDPIFSRFLQLAKIQHKAYPKDYFTTARNKPNFGAEVNQTAPFTIRQFRQNAQIQELLEKQLRTGFRYTEFLKAFFNANNRDESLQRPQFLGGGRQPIIISEVVQSSASDGGPLGQSPIGTRVGIGHSFSADCSFNHHFTEHGYIMGIMYIAPKPMYMNGIDRTHLRGTQILQGTRYDWYLPEFQNIGEEAIKNAELGTCTRAASVNSITPDPSNPDYAFGYQTRDAYYKTPSVRNIHGDFRTTLITMHAARPFTTITGTPQTPIPWAQPLNKDFIRYSPWSIYESYPNFANRIFAVYNNGTSFQSNFWCELSHAISAVRPMVAIAKPTLGYHNL